MTLTAREAFWVLLHVLTAGALVIAAAEAARVAL